MIFGPVHLREVLRYIKGSKVKRITPYYGGSISNICMISAVVSLIYRLVFTTSISYIMKVPYLIYLSQKIIKLNNI